MILFLNKKDLFAEKIKTTNITKAFPDYKGLFSANVFSPEEVFFFPIGVNQATNFESLILGKVCTMTSFDSHRGSTFILQVKWTMTRRQNS